MLPGGDTADTVGRVEFVTTIRGRRVSCWIEDGHLCGDPVLLARLARFGDLDQQSDPVEVARLVRDAVGSEVTIRLIPDDLRPCTPDASAGEIEP